MSRILVTLAITLLAARATAGEWRKAMELSTRRTSLVGSYGPTLGRDTFARLKTLEDAALADFVAQVKALEDSDPELPEAACRVYPALADKHAAESLLRRAVAAIEGTGAVGPAQRYDSLDASLVAIEPIWRARSNGELEADPNGVVLGGTGFHDCAHADSAHLRVLLSDLYSAEHNFPRDPFTGNAWPGQSTSKKHVERAELAELDELLRLASRDLGATHPYLATILELKMVYCADLTGAQGRCGSTTEVLRRALRLRENGLAAGADLLAQSRVLLATTLYRQGDRREAERLLRQAMTLAAPGYARLIAVIDLAGVLQSSQRGQEMEALLPSALESARAVNSREGPFAVMWLEIFESLFRPRRPDLAAQVLRTMIDVLAAASVGEDAARDQRWTLAAVWGRLGELEAAAEHADLAAAAQATAARLRTELRARQDAEQQEVLGWVRAR